MANALNFGLEQSLLKNLNRIFSKHPEITQVVLYGSRAMGTYRPNSDIDLTVKTSTAPPDNLLFKLMDEIDNLDLIYSFDISLFEDIENPNLIEHINRVGKPIFHNN